jgi:hypothetical protein
MPVRIHIFNQYYFAFLKKIKDIARDLKHKNTASSETEYKNPDLLHNKVLKAIKNTYASYDTSSNEYHEWFINNEELQNAFEVWSNTVKTSQDVDTWISSVKADFYKDISIENIAALVDNKRSVYYNIAILYIFSHDISDTELPQIVELIKNLKDKEVFEKDIGSLENETIRTTLQVLMELQQESVGSSMESSFKELEETSLGKLAKDIMTDINLDEIQSSLQNEGDIFKALSNPNGGLSKLLGTVSQKMISKMASGEIKQETLLQDALAFSSQLKNMAPANKDGSGASSAGAAAGLGGLGGLGDLGDIGSMLEQFQKMAGAMGGMGGGAGGSAGSGAGGGLGGLQEMMAAMGMGGMAGMAGMGGMGGAPKQQGRGVGGGGGGQTRVDANSMNRLIKTKQLRNKLAKKKQQEKSSKENVQTVVEDE